MRFLADMGISPATVAWLRASGHDAIHLAEEGLHRLSDAEIVAKARAEQRVILTVDLDFGDLLALSGEGQPSVIIFRLVDRTPDSVNSALDRCIPRFHSLIGAGSILSVDETTVRTRPLPLRFGEDGLEPDDLASDPEG